MIQSSWKKLAPISVIILAVVGGIFFGLFSCGGYLWHHQVFYALFVTALVVALLFPPKSLKNWKRKSSFIFVSIAGFILVRAIASAFYPAAPESIEELIHSIWLGILYGPC